MDGEYVHSAGAALPRQQNSETVSTGGNQYGFTAVMKSGCKHTVARHVLDGCGAQLLPN
eukprot:m.683873 g.683873  ORF g.683873 m.683873 type:complete len:59 (+) comp22831_c0_seq7:4650-4826(+)